MNKDMPVYFSGGKLYGDDFAIEQIEEWFNDEKEGYADLGAGDKATYKYVFHKLNYFHGYKFLKDYKFDRVLGIGSAYGDEFKPIIEQLGDITILEPSDAFVDIKEILGIPCKYVKPHPSGDLPFDSNEFDFISALGVMHHIPNVTHVMGECFRCLKENGIMLIRDPIVSMGDWSKTRPGLTKRERGIPLEIFENVIRKSGFMVVHKSLCVFPLIPKLASRFRIAAYNSRALTLLDSILSHLFAWNYKYHRTNILEKLSPAAVYFVLKKHAASSRMSDQG